MAVIVDVTGEGRDDGVRRAAEALRTGQAVVLPTDTRYGVAADAFDPAGTLQVFAAKGRDRRLPLPVLVRSPKQLAGLTTVVPDAAELLVAAYWPGPLTIVLAAEPNLRWDLGDAEGTVAVRMPFDDVALEVIRAVGPLAVTGAGGPHGQLATTVAEAAETHGDRVAVYLDDGPRAGTTSTIVDVTRREPTILRPGSLDGDQVLAVARGEVDPSEAATWQQP